MPSGRSSGPSRPSCGEGTRTERRTIGSRFWAREGLLFAIAAAASFAFQFHGVLYLDGRSPPEFRIEPFFFVMGLSYLFLRFVVLAVEMRPTRAAQAQPVRCPECGQWIDGATSEALEAHRRAESPPKPLRKRAVATVALRRAVDAVRFSAQARDPDRVVGDPSVGPAAENLTGQELVAALDDPDFLERARHGPSPPERRIRR